MNIAEQAIPMSVHNMERASAPRDEIVSASEAGSPVTFEELHAIYSRRLYRTIAAITKNPEDAEDALQDTFLRAHLALHTFKGGSSIYSWLTRIAINSALTILRKRRARPELSFDSQPDDLCGPVSFEVKDSALNPEEAYDLRQRQLQTLQAIHLLEPRLQAPIRMQLVHGRSLREISRALSISEATVKARLYRARRRLSATCADPKLRRQCRRSRF
jgi:RNA polymerase sigma-70 factor, ECF subfamily